MKNTVQIKFILFVGFLLFAAGAFAQKTDLAGTVTYGIPTLNVEMEDHSTQKIHGAAISEPHRPLFHFTPAHMWMNDPNGLVYFEGEYHLFYQYYPEATVWGPMHWGHAISKDLMNWQHLPIALYPDSLGLIFSGSAVVDWNNTSGLGQNGKAPLIAIFTQHLMEGEKAGRTDFQYQSLAYSNDRGRTWTKYSGNPVLPNTLKIKDFRDPKVIWHQASKQWIMVFAAYDHVKLWASPDLKNWKHLSDFGKEWGAHGGVWECPDFFPLRVEGSAETKWVLLQSLNPGAANGGSGTQYFIGDFDGTTFTLDPDFAHTVQNGHARWLDWGRDNYAGVTWSDIPAEDGRRIFIGWMSNWDYATVVPTDIWRSACTLPRTLTLVRKSKDLLLLSTPVVETEKLRRNSVDVSEITVQKTLNISALYAIQPSCMEMELEVEIPESSQTRFTVVLSNTKGEQFSIGYDAKTNQYFSDRTRSGNLDFSNKFAPEISTAHRNNKDNILQLHLFFDVASCELFADQGEVVMTDIFFPGENFDTLQLMSSAGPVRIVKGKLYNLQMR